MRGTGGGSTAHHTGQMDSFTAELAEVLGNQAGLPGDLTFF